MARAMTKLQAPQPASAIAQDRLDWAKWSAVALMAANHLCLALPAPWPTVGHAVGRPCLALFAVVLASRLAERPEQRVRAAAVRLLVWGVVAQLPYLLLVGGVALRLNVLFTLAMGVGGFWLWRDKRFAWLAAAALGAAAINPWLDGGALGAAAVSMAAALTERGRRTEAGLAAATLVAAANLLADPSRAWAAAAVFAALPILWLSQRLPRAPRLPGWLFYAFYPAHLALIWLILGPYA